jgi:hypothetical protein
MTDRATPRIFTGVIVAVIAIALGSFALSYSALLALAIDNGVPARLAWIWPLIVDVSVIVFTGAILVAQLQNRGARLAIGLTMFYGIVTIAGNLLHAPATVLGWFVAALPPLSLIFATEMLRAMAHHSIKLNNAVVTLQELTKQAAQRAQELANITGQLSAKQSQLTAVQEQLNAAKSSKNVDFAESMTAAKQQAVAERRAIVLQMAQAGHTQKSISETLGKDVRTIRADIAALNGQVNQ